MSVTLFWLSNFSSSQEALTALNQTNRPFHRASEVRFAVTRPKFVTMTTMHQSHNRDIQLPFYRGASQSLLSTVACPYDVSVLTLQQLIQHCHKIPEGGLYVERVSCPRLTDVRSSPVCRLQPTPSYVSYKISINFSLHSRRPPEVVTPNSRSGQSVRDVVDKVALNLYSPCVLPSRTITSKRCI